MPAPPRAQPLEVRLLGGLSASVAGTEIDLGGPKQRMIFAVLVLGEGRVVSLDRIIDVVWSGEPPDRAEVSVRGYVSNLRKMLARRCPEVDLQWRALGYVLSGPIQIDVRQFEQSIDAGRQHAQNGRMAAARNQFQTALDLWRGTPFGAYAPSLRMEDVVARWEELRGEALERWFDTRLALGEHREAVADLQLAVGNHPFREHLRVLLATALYRCDRPVDALRSINNARRVLVDEAGVEPSVELRAVESMILAEDPSLSAPEATAPDPITEAHGSPATTFVGRAADLDALATVLDQVTVEGPRGPGGRAIIVGGEAGVGKTTLVEHLADIARRHGYAVASARCSTTTGAAPYWCWRSLAVALANEESCIDIGTAIVSLLDSPHTEHDADESQARLVVLSQLVSHLQRLPVKCLLVIEDVQWADVASLSLLEFVANELPRLPIALAVTVRTETTPHDRVRDCLSELSRSTGSTRRELQGLDLAATAVWLTTALGARASTELASIVHRRTGGNPFFVREMLALLAAGQGDGSVLEAAARAIPVAVHDAVRRRTSLLDADTQRLLISAAVIGREFDVDVLALVSELPRERVLELLEPAIDGGIVDLDPSRPNEGRFTHALIVDALAAELNAIRRARAHADVTRAFTSRWAGDIDAVLPQVAFHAFAGATAGTARDAVVFSIRAAQAASRAGSPEAAVGHLERALIALDLEAPLDAARRVGLLLELGLARGAAGDVSAGRSALLEAARRAETLGDMASLVRALSYVNADDLWTSLDWGQHDAETIALIERALRALPEDADAERSALLASLGGQLYHFDPGRASKVAAEAVTVAERTGDALLLFRVLLQHYWTEWRPSGTGTRTHVADRMLGLVGRGDLPRHFTPLAHLARFTTAYETGDRILSDRHLRLARASADPIRTPSAWSYVLYAQVSIELLRGDLDRAEATIEELHAALMRSRRFVADTTRAGLRLQLLVERGAIDEALSELTVLDSSLYGSPISWFRAWALAEGGRSKEAAAALDAFDGPIADDWFKMPLLTAAVSAAAGCGHVDFLRRHLDEMHEMAGLLACTGSGGIVMGPVALALARGHHALGDDAEAAVHMATARNLIERMGATPWARRANAHCD